MLTLLALMLGLAAGEQQAASGTIISADEIAATLKQSIANNTVDQPIKLAQLPGGHKASVAMLRRTKAETSALIHDYVTEIYEIVEGSGTLVTGGSLEDPKESDLTRVNAGMSHTGAHKGGESRKVKVEGRHHRAGWDGPSLQRARRPDRLPGLPVRAEALGKFEVRSRK